MSWEERFFGTAPAALTAQVEGRHVKERFPEIPQTDPGTFDADDMRVLDFRFIQVRFFRTKTCPKTTNPKEDPFEIIRKLFASFKCKVPKPQISKVEHRLAP